MLAGSLALLADAGHNLGDVSAAARVGREWPGPAAAHRAAHLRVAPFLILVAVVNTVVLLVGMGAMAWESVGRCARPEPGAGGVGLVVAGAGVAINARDGTSFPGGRERDLNGRGAFLHMMADAAVSLGVVVAGVLGTVRTTRFDRSGGELGDRGRHGVGDVGLLGDGRLALDAIPQGMDPAASRVPRWAPRLTGMHDLHIWAMSATETALTAHLMRQADGRVDNAWLAGVRRTSRRSVRHRARDDPDRERPRRRTVPDVGGARVVTRSRVPNVQAIRRASLWMS